MHTLTKEDIKALREADDVHARRSGRDQSQLEAVKRNPGTVFSESEGRRVIPTDDRFTAFDRDYHTEPDKRIAFAYSIGGSWHRADHWRTITNLLRTGDVLRLHWTAGNSSGYLKAARGVCVGEGVGGGEYRIPFQGLYHDMLDLEVIRNGKLKYAFHLADSVCPDNSARMIRG